MKRKPILLLLAVSFVLRCLLAGAMELNNDEVYYWTYAQHLQWNYFDHPPFIAFLLRFFTANLLWQDEFFLRLGSVVCGTFSTWLIYLIGKRIKDEQTGLLAACLFTASFYGTVIAGLLVMPDAPQMVFWLLSILLMIKITGPKQNLKKLPFRLVMLGLAIGACMLSKLHGVFLWAGFAGYVIFCWRQLLKSPWLYCSVVVTLLLLLPVVLWNADNGFISYAYHSNRVELWGPVRWEGFLRELFGEVLYNNPVNFVLLLMALTALARKKWRLPSAAGGLAGFIALPLIAVVVLLSLHRDTLPHWTGPAYVTLIPLTAAWLRLQAERRRQKGLPYVVKFAMGLTLVLLLLAIIVVKWLPYNVGSREWQRLGANDITLDMNGWKNFGARFDSLKRKDIRSGVMKKGAFLISDYWFPAAHIDYYVARPAGIPFVAIGGLPAIHHYAWLNLHRPALAEGSDAYFITVSNYFNVPDKELAEQFNRVEVPVTVTQHRNGVAVRNFFIYRLKDYKGTLPRSGVLQTR